MTTNLTGTLDQNGGVTSIQFSKPAAEPGSLGAHRAEPHKVIAGTHRNGANPNGSQDAESAYLRFDVGTQTHSAGDSIMSTLRNGGSQGASVELEPGNPASRTSLAVAERMGLITRGDSFRDAAGFNQPVEPATPAASADLASPEGPSETPEHFDAQELDDFTAVIEPMPQAAFDSATAVATNAVLTGGTLKAAGERLATMSGVEPELAHAQVTAIHAMYAGAVDRALEPIGITADNRLAFHQFARETNGGRTLQNAVSVLLVQRDVQPFEKLAQEFIAGATRRAEHAAALARRR